MLRRTFLSRSAAALVMTASPGQGKGLLLAHAAQTQVGVTTGYDPRYERMAYPNGDVPRSTGVCADVIVRAARDGLGLDLQLLVHEDMTRSFAAYPRSWGMLHPDTNIDHRRVLNLETYWRRNGGEVWHTPGVVAGDAFPAAIQVGDVLTWMLDARLPHTGIVIAVRTGETRLVHNIGGGAQEIGLAAFQPHRAKGHYRWPAA